MKDHKLQQLRIKLKNLRIKLGWSQEDLAREIGVSLSTIQRWESKKIKPHQLARRQLDRLFQEFNIDVE